MEIREQIKKEISEDYEMMRDQDVIEWITDLVMSLAEYEERSLANKEGVSHGK